MKRIIHTLPLLTACAAIVACSSAPFSNETSAQSNGKGNWSTQIGATAAIGGGAGVFARQGYGVTQDWDLGIDAETLSQQAGIWTRYSFVNQPQSTSFALLGGMGYGENDIYIETSSGHKYSSHEDVYNAYFGPIVSHKHNDTEFFALMRANFIWRSNGKSVEADMDDEVNFSPDSKYGSASSGANYWFNDHVAITGDVNILFDSKSVSTPYFNAGFVFKY